MQAGINREYVVCTRWEKGMETGGRRRRQGEAGEDGITKVKPFVRAKG